MKSTDRVRGVLSRLMPRNCVSASSRSRNRTGNPRWWSLEALEDRSLMSFQALLTPTTLSANPSAAVTFDVNYQTQNNSGTPTVLPANGITVSTFFNSSKLTFQSVTNVLQTDLFDDAASLVTDVNDLDGDPLTDKYFNLIWNNGNSAFPTGSQPLKLFTANFTAAANFTGSTAIEVGGKPGANFQIKSSSLTVSATAPQLPSQVLTPSNTAVSAAPSTPVTFDVNYSTLNANGVPVAVSSNGITVSTFFNSSKLTFQSVTNLLQTDLFDDAASLVNDVNDLDGDPLTDKYFNLIWNNGNSTFPAGSLPLKLFTANFTAAANFSGSTAIEVGGKPGANFQIQSSSLTVTATAPQLSSQVLTPSNTAVSAAPSAPVTFDVNYSTLNASGVPVAVSSNGITVSTFFNSSKLTFQSVTNLLQTDLFDDAASLVNDVNDLDGDPLTDKYFNLIWNNGNSAFPTGTLPLRLFTANFVAAANFAGTSQIRLGGLPGANFKIESTPVTVTATTSGTAPTTTISSSADAITNSSPIPFSIQFSSAVTGFTSSDIVVTGGVVSGFAGSGAAYTFNVIPSAQGTVTVNVPANRAQGSTGLGNLAATAVSRIYDSLGPVFTSPFVVSVVENSVSAVLLTTTEPNGPVTYAISGGDDAGAFTLDPTTGLLSFLVAPVYASPGDADGNNSYFVGVTATDSGGNSSLQFMLINVTNSSVLTPSITPATRSHRYIIKSPSILVFGDASFGIIGSPNPNLSQAQMYVSGPDSKVKKVPYIIGIRSTGTGVGQIQVQGSNVLYEGTVIGTTTGFRQQSIGRRLHWIGATFDFNSSATVASIQALMRAVTFSQSKPKPSSQIVSLSFFSDKVQFPPGSITGTTAVVNVARK